MNHQQFKQITDVIFGGAIHHLNNTEKVVDRKYVAVIKPDALARLMLIVPSGTDVGTMLDDHDKMRTLIGGRFVEIVYDELAGSLMFMAWMQVGPDTDDEVATIGFDYDDSKDVANIAEMAHAWVFHGATPLADNQKHLN